MSDITRVAKAICKSKTCEGFMCCQNPAQMGRLHCPVAAGGYNDAARAAIEAMRPDLTPAQEFAAWLENGPRLAKAAGYVGIKVSAALSQDTHSLPPTPEAANAGIGAPPPSDAGTNSEAQP